MPPKRPSARSPTVSNRINHKHVKTEHRAKLDDFSNSVKRRLASSTRTGQACDRCKIRKIRCDGVAGGCTPCRQSNADCRTTDRITGRATTRGYVEGLEHQTLGMKSRIEDLEARLIAMGAEVKPSNFNDTNHTPVMDWSTAGLNGNSRQPWESSNDMEDVTRGGMASYEPGPSGSSSPRGQETNVFRALPVFRAGCTGDNYLGVSSGNSHLSSIKGTALSVLGMEIDTADFSSSDMDEPSHSMFETELYNKSYQSFLQSAHNVNPRLQKVELPPRAEGLTYAQWYFRVLNPYLPMLHKPSFMTLLARIYDEPEFRPIPAELVMVHMVFATMFFQYAARNWENATQQSELNTRSNLHYHYSLGFYHQLCASHTLQDVQALTMICAHLRNFPKPGASWMVANIALTLAIELGLHRSATRWVQSSAEENVLDVEMRKRVFWSILIIHVTLGAKLGRPMPLRLDDFDVELPEAIDDELLSATGLDTSEPGKCAFRIGLEAFKFLPLIVELTTTLYAVKRNPRTYVETVNRLEMKLKKWRARWPTELIQESAENEQEGRVFSLYIQLWALEFRLLLRHPSVSLTADVKFNKASLEICVESAFQMLQVVKQLQHYKSLDTTWYQGAVYLMAITTTLFASWEKRNEITPVDVSNLREQMDQWLSIMEEVGALLGSGNRLKEAVRVVTDGTLGMLSRALTSNITVGPTMDKVTSRARSRSPRGPAHLLTTFPTSEFSTTYQDPSHPNATHRNITTHSHPPRPARRTAKFPKNPNAHTQPAVNPANAPSSFRNATAYSYSETSTSSALGYRPTQSSSFADSAYPGPDGSMPSLLTNTVIGPSSALAPGPTPSIAATAYELFGTTSNSSSTTPIVPVSAFAQQQAHNWNPGSYSWRQWTGTMATHLEPQDCYSASALMQLGGRDHDTQLQQQQTTQSNGQGPLATGVSGVHTAAAAQAADVAAVAAAQAAVNAEQHLSVQPWPLMIFDIGQGAMP